MEVDVNNQQVSLWIAWSLLEPGYMAGRGKLPIGTKVHSKIIEGARPAIESMADHGNNELLSRCMILSRKNNINNPFQDVKYYVADSDNVYTIIIEEEWEPYLCRVGVKEATEHVPVYKHGGVVISGEIGEGRNEHVFFTSYDSNEALPKFEYYKKAHETYKTGCKVRLDTNTRHIIQVNPPQYFIELLMPRQMPVAPIEGGVVDDIQMAERQARRRSHQQVQPQQVQQQMPDLGDDEPPELGDDNEMPELGDDLDEIPDLMNEEGEVIEGVEEEELEEGEVIDVMNEEENIAEALRVAAETAVNNFIRSLPPGRN